ncbi:FAH family protein [delta proteobacterium NaphS2]|nr:FAH family protein [delta proteobacterium NaphS2]
MRIIRFEDEDARIRYGLDQATVLDGAAGGRVELLEGNPYDGLELTGERAGLIRLLAPVIPTNIFCVGRNYVDHIEEFDKSVPEYPILFLKNTASLNDPGAPIRIPKCQMRGPEVDFEGELAVVIGKRAKDVNEREALDHVLGYTASNDISARRWQILGGGDQWCRGKGFDTFCPLGPVLLTPDEVGDPQNLHIQTRLNGEVMQNSNTSHMIHSVASLIAFLSQDTTLLPGTIILTGTPSGVGSARNPRIFLNDGDIIEVEIEKIGILRNPIAA